MRKWITRTAGAVLIGAAFTAAGTGIANADSGGRINKLGVWDTIVRQAVGPIRNVCEGIADRASRLNADACAALPGSDRTSAATTVRAPADQAPQQQQQTTPQPNDQGSGGLLGGNGLPLLGNLKGLGLG